MTERPREVAADIDRIRAAGALDVRADHTHSHADVENGAGAMYMTLGVVVGVGLIGAWLLSRNRQERVGTGGLAQHVMPRRESAIRRGLNSIPEVAHMRHALIAVATSRLVSALNGWLPGFTEEFERSQSRNAAGFARTT